MKVLNREIFVTREPLDKLGEIDLPVEVSFQVARLANKLMGEQQIIEAVRMGLVRKYGKATEDGQIRVDPANENFPKFAEDFDALMTQEVELIVDKVILPRMVDGKPLQIKASILMPLEKFVTVEKNG